MTFKNNENALNKYTIEAWIDSYIVIVENSFAILSAKEFLLCLKFN